jgi:hypothetical protein
MPKLMLKIVIELVLFVLFVPANKLSSGVSEWNFPHASLWFSGRSWADLFLADTLSHFFLHVHDPTQERGAKELQ